MAGDMQDPAIQGVLAVSEGMLTVTVILISGGEGYGAIVTRVRSGLRPARIVARDAVRVATRARQVTVLEEGAKGSTNFLSKGELLKIENAATRINKPITVVGSRAKGTAGPYSDWDYVIEGLNSRNWSKIKNSLPGSRSILDNTPRNIDIFKGPVNPNLPHITIYPR